MAQADRTEKSLGGGGSAVYYQLLDAEVAQTDGTWVGVADLDSPTIKVSGMEAGDVVQIYATISLTVPVNSSNPDEDLQGSNLTADGQVILEPGFDFVKARVSTWASGTISALLKGQKKR